MFLNGSYGYDDRKVTMSHCVADVHHFDFAVLQIIVLDLSMEIL